MDLSQDLFDEIKAYVQNRMPPPEREAFDQRLAQNEELRQEVAFQRRLHQGLDAALVRRQFDAARAEQLRDRTRGQRTTYAVAASVALLLAVSVVFLTRGPRSPATQLAFADYYQPELARTEEALPPGLPEALTDYQAARYAAALRRLDALPDDSLHRVAYYRGLTYLALGLPTQAATALQVARKTTDLRRQRRAGWYLALTYLRANDAPRAAAALRAIAADAQHPYREKASEILSRIE